jgi:hypothetical protein
MSVSIVRTGLKGVGLAGAIAAAVVVTSGLAAAAPPAGEMPDVGSGPARVEIALSGDAEARLLARHGQIRDALGFPTGKHRGAWHVRDGFNHAEFDEVTEVAAGGEVLSVTQFDARGLRLAVRLDKPAASRLSLKQDRAVKAAEQAVRRAGLPLGPVAVAETDTVGGGLVVRWARTEDGVPVRGDEVRVGVRPDGRIASVSRVDHDLAAPARRSIGSARAIEIGRTILAEWSGQSESEYEIQGATLEWVEPNGIFDPERIGSTAGPYRQAWVVVAKPTGVATEHLNLLALFIDAVDGSLIGGDTVQ